MPVQARYFEGPLMGPLRAQNPFERARNGAVTSPLQAHYDRPVKIMGPL